jgi:signal transduction histidine kinase
VAEEFAAGGVTPRSSGRAQRAVGTLVRVLDVLPRAPALEPVRYNPLLLAFVGAVECIAVALAVLTVRQPSDGATLAVGAVVAFAMAAYAIRSFGAAPTHWTPDVFVQLGMSLVLGPVGAVTGAVCMALGLGIRARNGWYRTAFNFANMVVSNLAAYYAFTAVESHANGSGLVLVAAGLLAGVSQYFVNHGFLVVVVRLSNPTVPLWRIVSRELSVLPYSLGYGAGSFAFVVMHNQAGVIGFVALLMPVILLHFFLIIFARRVHAYEAERAAHQKEREELLNKSVEASEAERRRIARDLHDGVVQNLAGMAFALSATASEIKDTAKENGEQKILELLESSADETRSVMKDLRTLIIELAPPTLRREGLHAALLEVLRDIKRKGTKTKLDLPPNLRLREDRAALIFRVAQEILRNVAAHAEAKNVTVELKESGGMAVLRINDDGKGFTPKQAARRRAQGHLGTSSIVDLAEEVGGTLDIDSELGKGTRVTLRVPVE